MESVTYTNGKNLVKSDFFFNYLLGLGPKKTMKSDEDCNASTSQLITQARYMLANNQRTLNLKGSL